MTQVHLVVLVLAFACFALRAAGVSSRIDLLALGLALWVLTLIV
jgi:hypothetical protein